MIPCGGGGAAAASAVALTVMRGARERTPRAACAARSGSGMGPSPRSVLALASLLWWVGVAVPKVNDASSQLGHAAERQANARPAN